MGPGLTDRPVHHFNEGFERRSEAFMSLILLIVLVVLLLGALPAWPYSRSWGYYPSGGLGLVVVILLVLLVAGRL